MWMSNNEITVVEQLNIKTRNIEIRFLNGYNAVREELDENNTLTAKLATYWVCKT